MLTGDAKASCGSRYVAPGFKQGASYKLLLLDLAGLAQGFGGMWHHREESLIQEVSCNNPAGSQQDCPFNYVCKLPDVAWPGVGNEGLHYIIRYLCYILVEFG